jgi:AcrR family transcriptional regulator
VPTGAATKARSSTAARGIATANIDRVVPDSARVRPDPSVRDRLVAAAAEVFAERGYEGARVQEIVRRAGLSTGAIYTNFRNKADLLLAAVGTAQVDSLFATIELAGDAADGLRHAGHELPTARRDTRPLLFEAMVAARRDPEVAALLRRRLMKFRSLMAHAVAAGFCQALGMGFLLMEAVGLPHSGETEWRELIDRLVDSITPGDGKEQSRGQQ